LLKGTIKQIQQDAKEQYQTGYNDGNNDVIVIN
jgi:hypothetical protein